MTNLTRILSRLTLMLAMLGVWGCITDSYDGATTSAGECYVRVQVTVRGGSLPATRAGGYADTFLETIDVLSFREDDRTFQYRARATAIDTANEWFDIVLNKSRDERQVLVILANLGDELDAATLTAGVTTIEDLQSTLTHSFAYQTFHDPDHTTLTPGRYGEDRPLPMWGQSEPLAIVTETLSIGTIYMLRSLAAVTVLINLDPNDAAQKPFRMVDVAVYNVADRGSSIPDPANIDDFGTSTMIAATPTIPAATIYNAAYFHSTDGVTVSAPIYLGEKTNTGGVPEDDRTWLLVSGYYDDDTDVTWYRVPFVDREGKLWDVLRNHNYIFNIYKVTGPGNTEEEAKDADIYADVIPWNMGADAGFDIDGQYWIWVDPTTASYEIEGGTGQVTVETNYPGGVSATVSASATERDVPCPWLTSDAAPTGSVINYTVSANSGWETRTGYIHVTAGSFAVTVRIDQKCLYIESASVTPTGDIPGDGESRTLRLTGLFDDIDVRVMDVSNNTELTQAPADSFVPGNLATGNPSSVTVVIPAWASGAAREIAIQYFDKKTNAWVTAQQATQEGYNFQIATNLTDGATIATSNASYTVNVTGPSWPELYVRAVIQGTTTVVGGPHTIPAGTGASTSQTITIDTYRQWTDQAARAVEIQYSRDNTNWTALNYGNQIGNYTVTGSTIVDPGIVNGEKGNIRAILPGGGPVEVTVSGNYESGWVQVRSIRRADANTQVSTTTPAITDVATGKVTMTIGTNYNYTGDSQYGAYAGHRDIMFQYRRYIPDATGTGGTWQSTWTDIAVSDVKQLGYVTLQTSGRVVAIDDAWSGGPNGVGDEIMLWATAMGVSSAYNSAEYTQAAFLYGQNISNDPNSGNYVTKLITRTAVPYYTVTYAAANGGCAAYTEGGYTGNFYIPTIEEAMEMGVRFEELGKIAFASPWDYWTNSEMIVTPTAGNDRTPFYASIVHDLEYTLWAYNNRSTISKRARCVRAK